MNIFIPITSILLLASSCNNSTPNIDFKNAIEEANYRESQMNVELRVITNLDEGMNQAKKEDKPILLYFTGYAAVNSRKLEADLIQGNKTVFKAMKHNFINVWLYVDDVNNGDKWSAYQHKTFNADKTPYFVLLNADGEPISKGYNYDEAMHSLESELLKYN